MLWGFMMQCQPGMLFPLDLLSDLPPQITDQEAWQDNCLDKGGVCIVAALSADEAERQNQLEVLRAAAERRAEQPLYFCWFEAARVGAGQQFAERLGLGGGQAPALVAVSPKKERSAVMTGRFEKVRWKARQAMAAI